MGDQHVACRALARAVGSDDAGDWRAAKEILSDLPEQDWNEIKRVLRADVADPAARLN